MSEPSAAMSNERGPRAPFVWAGHASGRGGWQIRQVVCAVRFRLAAAMWRALLRIAPEEQVGERVPPWTALFRPGPCAAFCLLLWNDHVGKGSAWLPTWVAGKLSDFAGVAFFPLLLVTILNSMLYLAGRRYQRVAPYGAMHLWHLQLSCLSTGIAFGAIQLFPAVADLYRQLCIALVPWNDGRVVRVVSDPTDLWALWALLLSYRWGRQAIAQLPPGRLDLACRKARGFESCAQRLDVVRKALSDVQQCQPKRAQAPMERLLWACANRASVSERSIHLHQVRQQR